MDPQRFRLATRIHFALLRQYGVDVDVASLLKGSPEGREALWVCQASNDRELVALAVQFERRRRVRREPADAPQDAAWARDTSGFGISVPAELVATPRAAPRELLKPSSWLRSAR